MKNKEKKLKAKKTDENEISDEERQTQDMSVVADYDGEMSNRAKVVDFEGDDYVDAPVKDNSLDGKMANLWYHHKWKIIFIPIIAFCLITGLVQVFSGEKVDANAMYAGPAIISGDNYKALDAALDEVLTADSDGNGKANAYLYTINYYTQKQIEDQKAEYAEQGIYNVTFNDQNNVTAYQDYNNMILAGKAGVLFVDRELFEKTKTDGGLATLESALGYTPEGAVDEYGIRLGDTDFYEFYKAAQLMPEDTIVCLRGVGNFLISKKEAQKTFEQNKQLFCDVVNFKLPEGYVKQ